MKTVFIVDQDEDDVTLLNDCLLETFPELQIEIASDCDLVIEQIKHQKPDVVFLEPYLPPESGDKYLQEIRSSPECQHVIVVILSGYYRDKQAATYLANGADYYFEKPASFPELKSIIQTVFQEERD